jgi:hypothetical protein
MITDQDFYPFCGRRECELAAERLRLLEELLEWRAPERGARAARVLQRAIRKKRASWARTRIAAAARRRRKARAARRLQRAWRRRCDSELASHLTETVDAAVRAVQTRFRFLRWKVDARWGDWQPARARRRCVTTSTFQTRCSRPPIE